MTKRILYPGLVGVGIAVFLAASLARLSAGQGANGPIAIDADDIAGVVTSAKGPEAGVWVIAETTSLPTKFSKTVVTDDQGRYLVPDLPKGTYTVWVRGYGLVDSKKVQAAPGKVLNLTAVIAPNPREAAQILSGQLLAFPGSGAREERVPGHRAPKGTASRRTSRARPTGSPASR